MRTRGSMSIVDSAWLAAGATSRRHSAASRADVQMTAGVEPSSRAGVFRRMLTSRARRRRLQGVDELLHPACGRHHALPCRSARAAPPRQTRATRSGAQDRRRTCPGGLDRGATGSPGVPAHAHPIRRRSRAAGGAASPARSPSRTAPRASSDSPGSAATAWVAGGRCNEPGWTTGWSTASEARGRGTRRRRAPSSSSPSPRSRRDRVASGASRSGRRADRSSRRSRRGFLRCDR